MKSASALPRNARINDIDLSIFRATITDVDTNGAVVYADGFTVHLALPVVLELAKEFDRWNEDVTA